jgi:large subunit ribosomal protein L18
MKNSRKSRHSLIERRKLRVRKHLRGSAEKPRLSVFRSSQHIYAQLIDDEAGLTIASASTIATELRDSMKDLVNKEQAKLVGVIIAQKAKAANIQRVVFDRGPYKFHGRIKELAEAARENGLIF